MNLHPAVAIILPVLLFQPSNPNRQQPTSNIWLSNQNPYPYIKDIPLPPGYQSLPAPPGSFAGWLRERPLKKSNTVYLYNGMPKRNQQAQFAVLDIPIGKENLQQCADAVMRLRAEYLFSASLYDQIAFNDNGGHTYRYQNGNNRAEFEAYLRKVFSWCGTASLAKQLKPVQKMEAIVPGDVLIKGGFPGHAVIVMNVAVNRQGQKIYLLAQSYMPAQNIHILRNPNDETLSPWYKAIENLPVITPEWVFEPTQLMRW